MLSQICNKDFHYRFAFRNESKDRGCQRISTYLPIHHVRLGCGNGWKILKPVDDSGRIVEDDSVAAISVAFNTSFVVWTGLSVVVDWSNVVGASVTG